MAMKWKVLGYGTGAVIAAVSSALALSPNERWKASLDSAQKCPDAGNPKILQQQSTVMMTISEERQFEEAVEKSKKLCQRLKNELGLPGLTVGVSVNGKMVWQEGFGFSNIENNVKMKPNQILRIASISKSMTMGMMAKLMEDGKIDIDKPIQTYLPTFPEKYVDGEKVTITTRHLLSHLSGIRHYTKKENEQTNESGNSPKTQVNPKDDMTKGNNKTSKRQRNENTDEMELAEYFIKDKYKSVEEALKLFQNDELFHKPGTKYMYTTHGWTVVSAIIEKLTDTEFPKYAKKMFDYWGLKNTYLDLHEPIIYNRSSYYTRHKDGELINSPYVDNSYKWAGGGFLSNVQDLNQFAHILLYSMQTNSSNELCEKGLMKTPFLKQETMKTIWNGQVPRAGAPDTLYGLGFVIADPLRKCMFCKERDFMTVLHTGAAVGSSSVLLMTFPVNTCPSDNTETKDTQVKGVVVAMITNMTSVSLSRTALDIANSFRVLM